MVYKADGSWDYEDDSVSGKVTGLMSKNNPLMQQAQTQAKQFANRRGLLNTSMAAGAGVDAAVKSALPIASQDASQTHAKNLTAMNTASSEKVADMNVAAHDRQYAISATADMEKTYLAGWTEVMKNNSLSAADRTKLYEHLQSFADRDKGLIEQMYGITLSW